MPRRHTARTIAIVAIVAGAAWLRFHAIDAKSFWIDEGASVAIARMDWFDFARLLWRREANMTLYYLLLRGWIHLGGSEAFIRALSVVFALATFPILYLLGKRLFGRRAGLVACVLLAVNAFHIRYSQEARAYTLVVLLVTLASLFLVDAIERPANWKWNAYSVTSALAVYAQFYAVLVVLAHVVWWWRARPSIGSAHLRRALSLFGILTTPVWVFILTTGAGPLRWLERPGVTALREFVSAITGNSGWLLTTLYVALAAAGIIAVRPRSDRDGAVRSPGWFAGYSLLVPVVVTLVVSFIKPVFLPRYLIICLPPLVLLAAARLVRLPKTASAAVLIGVTALSLQGDAAYYVRDFDLLREDWRGATRFVLDHQQPGDAILFHANQGRMPFDYYAHLWNRTGPAVYFPGHDGQVTWRDFMGSPTAHQLEAAVSQGRRVWLVLSHTGDADPAKITATGTLENHLGHPVTTDFDGVQVLLYSR